MYKHMIVSNEKLINAIRSSLMVSSSSVIPRKTPRFSPSQSEYFYGCDTVKTISCVHEVRRRILKCRSVVGKQRAKARPTIKFPFVDNDNIAVPTNVEWSGGVDLKILENRAGIHSNMNNLECSFSRC